MKISAMIAIAIVPNGAGNGSCWITQMMTPSTKHRTSSHIRSVITDYFFLPFLPPLFFE